MILAPKLSIHVPESNMHQTEGLLKNKSLIRIRFGLEPMMNSILNFLTVKLAKYIIMEGTAILSKPIKQPFFMMVKKLP